MRALATDLHAHLVPGVDDGSRGVVETVAMAHGLARLGFARVNLTPHQFRFGNDFAASELRHMRDTVAALLARAGIALEVVAGAEYLYGERFLAALERGEELVAAEAGGELSLLVELPPDRPAVGVRAVAERLRARGLRPVLAHPERLSASLAPPERLAEWRAAGWHFQLNLPSLVGAYGPPTRLRAEALVREGSIDFVGSDLHRPSELKRLAEAREAFLRLHAAGVAR